MRAAALILAALAVAPLADAKTGSGTADLAQPRRPSACDARWRLVGFVTPAGPWVFADAGLLAVCPSPRVDGRCEIMQVGP